MEGKTLLVLALTASLHCAFGALDTITVSSATPSVAENSAGGTTILSGITANLPATGWTLTGTDSASFEVTPTATASATDTVTVKTKSTTTLDYESKTSYSFTISATDGTDTATKAITLSVTDVNESPSFSGSYAVKLSTGASSSTTVVTALATDPDSGNTVTHALVGASDTKVFQIGSSSGVVTIKSGITLSNSGEQYFLTVTAKDSASTPITATTYVAVCIGTCSGLCSASTATNISATFVTVVLALLVRLS